MLLLFAVLPLAISAAALFQTDPGLSPFAVQVMLLFQAGLPLISERLTELLRSVIPSIGDADGEFVSRWVGVSLFGGFAVVGAVVAPEIVIPTLPADGDAFALLAYGSAWVTALGAGLAWVVNGSRYVHDRVKGR